MLEIFGKQTHMFNSYLTLMLQLVYVATSYCTSYLTKIDKIVKNKLKNIIISCNENKFEAHTHIRKMGNDLTIYLTFLSLNLLQIMTL
jgi:hypothetical protein